MPETLYDKDGNEVELPFTVDEIKEIPTKMEELSKNNEEISEKLKRLENKDFNWKLLREMNDEERGKLSAAEIKLKEEQERHSEEIKGFQTMLTDNWKEKALYQLVGEDNELREKLAKEFDNIKGDAKSEVEIMTKMARAYTYVTGQKPTLDPLRASFGTGAGESPRPPEKNDKAPSSELKKFGQQFGVTEEDWDKFGNK